MQNRILLAAGLLLAAWVAQASTGTSPSYREQWRVRSFGSFIGMAGIWPVDADNDGDLDFVFDSKTEYGRNVWSIASYDAAGRYDIEWQSAPIMDPPNGVRALSALEVASDGSHKRVWVGMTDGTVEVVDLLTRQSLRTFVPAPTPINDFAFADIDNDGSPEVAVVTGSSTYLYDPDTLVLERTLPFGGARIATGNIDADAAIETAFNTGAVIEAATASATLEWAAPSSFGSRIEIADLDGDGIDELVAANWTSIDVWDLVAHSIDWSLTPSGGIADLRVIDVAGDSLPEIVYGDSQWGSIHAVNAGTHLELWNIPNPDYSISSIAIFDADGDGAREVLWGSGWGTSGADHLHVHDLATGAAEWQNQDFAGHYEAVAIGDVDADGELEMVVGTHTSDSGYSDGLILVFDAASNELEWSSSGNFFGGRALTGLHAIELVNVDDDPQLEIVVGTDQLYDGALFIIDGVTHQRQLATIYDRGAVMNSLDSTDLTGDGIPEIIAGSAAASNPGTFLYVVNPNTGAVIWQSPSLTATGTYNTVADVLAADIGLPGMDLIGVASQVHVVRWSDRRLTATAATDYYSVAAADIAANAGVELLAGDIFGNVDVLDGETLAVLSTHHVCSGVVYAIEIQSTHRAALVCDQTLIVYDFATSTIVDTTATNVPYLGLTASLALASTGGRSIIVVGGYQAVKFVDGSGNRVPQLTLTPVSVHWRDITDLQLSATDADSDTLRFEIVSLPLLGTATWLDASSGDLRYLATGERTGSDSLRVRVSDGLQYSTVETLQITLSNTPPNATTVRHDLNPGTTVTGRFGASDPDGDPLTYAVTRQPTRGTFTFDATAGTFQYTGTGSAQETDSVTFSASDGVSQAEATVEFRYVAPSPSGGNGSGGSGGGGGAFGTLLTALLGLLAILRRRAYRARLA